MDALAFIVTLSVVVAVSFWYVANETRGEDGAIGMFAIGGGIKAAPPAAARYRLRERLTPVRRAGVRAPGAQPAYRVKPADKPSYRAEGDGEADKEA